MEDLISRKAAIDALRTCQTYLFCTHDPDEKISLESAEYEIEQLPSAQQEQRSFSCSQENDVISRKAAIDALGEEPPVWYDGEDELAEREQWRRDVDAIKAVPSAQLQYEELTPEEAASEIACGSIMSAWHWLDVMMQLKQMGYAICRKR